GGVGLVPVGVPLGDGDELHDGDGGGGDAVGQAVDDPLHFGDDQGHRPGGPGAGGDDVDRRGAGLAEVLAGQVEDLLGVGVGVDGGHHPLDDAELVPHHLDHGGQPVGGAGGVGDDVVALGVGLRVVDAEDDGD